MLFIAGVFAALTFWFGWEGAYIEAVVLGVFAVCAVIADFLDWLWRQDV